MAAAPLDLLAVSLATAMVQCILYGIFVALFIKSCAILLNKQGYRTGKVHLVTLIVTIVQGVLITVHLAISIARHFDAFIYSSPLPAGSQAYYFDQTNPKYITVVALYLVEAVIADAFLIYRLYVIWGRNKYIILPACFTILVTLATGSVNLVLQRRRFPVPFGYIKTAQPYILTQYFSNVFTNIFCSGLIAWKIWSTDRSFQVTGASRSSAGHLKRTVRIIIDSALMYTISTILSASLFVAQTNLQLFFLFVTMPIIGISFCLIIVRVAGQISKTSTIPTTEPSLGPVLYASSGRETDSSYVDRLKVNIPHIDSVGSTFAGSEDTEMKFVRPKTTDSV